MAPPRPPDLGRAVRGVPDRHGPLRRHLAGAALRLAVLVALYQLYAFARNRHGLTSAGSGELARRHADALAALQDRLGLVPEHVLQGAVLPHEGLLRACGAFYGTAHFATTVAVAVLLATWRRARFDRWAATLVLSTFVAVVVFALYPVAPPRLVPGGAGTVDTLATVGGVWSYDHGVLERISDPYAALPSLHLAWATWCGLVLWELGDGSLRRGLWRAAAVLHPSLTLVAVLLTGNHWYLDAVAGTALVLAVHGGQVAVRPRRRRGTPPGADGPRHLDATTGSPDPTPTPTPTPDRRQFAGADLTGPPP